MDGLTMKEDTKTIEDHRAIWARIAKEHGWYVEPFYIQVFQNDAGKIWDSVANRGMTQDYVYTGEEFDYGEED